MQECVFPQATLQSSDPIKVTGQNGHKIENVVIHSIGGAPAIHIEDSSDVVIRNVYITHMGAEQDANGFEAGSGILFKRCPNIKIENVKVEMKRINPYVNSTVNPKCGSQYCGPFPSAWAYRAYSIEGWDSSHANITNVHLIGGSSGLWTQATNDMIISHLKVENVHGPYPRGQCVQVTRSHRVTLQDFHCAIDNDVGYTEDAISMWETEYALIQRGIIDGGNAPTGVAVMFERGHHGYVQDVDTTNNGGGCFSNYGSDNVTFLRTRAKDNHGEEKKCYRGTGYCYDIHNHDWCSGENDGANVDGVMVDGYKKRLDEMGNIYFAGDYNSHIGDGSHVALASNTKCIQGQFFNMNTHSDDLPACSGPDSTSCCRDTTVTSWEVDGANREEAWTFKEVADEDFTLRTPYVPAFESSWLF